MIDIFNLDDLNRVLGELGAFRADHQWVEAKRARTSLPDDLWTSLSAFANSDLGGLVLLGVHEDKGAFNVTGVEDPGKAMAALQAACTQLDPPLRPSIHLIEHPDGVVVAARITPLPRADRPCHRPDIGPRESSYIRVGDSDERMTSPEVDDLLANRSGTDHSRRPAPDDARLQPEAVASLLATARARQPRHATLEDARLLQLLGAEDDGRPTVAGLLTVGDGPQLHSAAARVAYRRLPRAGAASSERFKARHLEGTVGELLDDVMATLEQDLDRAQVVADGHLVDETDVPREALREIVSNALMHRSLAAPIEPTSISVEVSDELVIITSPGGVHVGTDPRTLGLSAMSAPRNLSLVRLSEMLNTPSGNRIVESQASGIAAADRACRAFGSAPALFTTGPARFEATFIRGRLDTTHATDNWSSAERPLDEDEARLTAFAHQLAAMQDQDALSHLRLAYLDTHLAARVLITSPEDAAIRLGKLEVAKVLTSRRLPDRTAWHIAPPLTGEVTAVAEAPAGKRLTRKDRIGLLLRALDASTDGELGMKDLFEPLGLTSTRSVSGVIKEASEAALIEATRDKPHDPARKYRLTRGGREQLRRTQS